MSAIEETLERIKNTPGVLGYLIVGSGGEILRQNLPSSWAKDKADQYASLVGVLSYNARHLVRDMAPQDELQYMRIRAQKHEILVAPGPRNGSEYTVMVIQEWTPAPSYT